MLCVCACQQPVSVSSRAAGHAVGRQAGRPAATDRSAVRLRCGDVQRAACRGGAELRAAVVAVRPRGRAARAQPGAGGAVRAAPGLRLLLAVLSAVLPARSGVAAVAVHCRRRAASRHRPAARRCCAASQPVCAGRHHGASLPAVVQRPAAVLRPLAQGRGGEDGARHGRRPAAQGAQEEEEARGAPAAAPGGRSHRQDVLSAGQGVRVHDARAAPAAAEQGRAAAAAAAAAGRRRRGRSRPVVGQLQARTSSACRRPASSARSESVAAGGDEAAAVSRPVVCRSCPTGVGAGGSGQQ